MCAIGEAATTAAIASGPATGGLTTATILIGLAAVATVATVAAAGLSAYGQMQQGKYQKDMAEYQRSLDIQRAAETRDAAGAAIMEQAERRRQQLATARTSTAAGGGMLDASTLDASNMWEQDQAYLGAYESEKIKRQAELQEWGFLSNADMTRSQGQMASWAGNLGASGAIIGGVGQATGQIAQGYSAYSTNRRLSALENA